MSNSKTKIEWHKTKSGKTVRIRTRTVGQCFGTEGQLVARGNNKVLAATRVYPYDMTGPAYAGALELLEKY